MYSKYYDLRYILLLVCIVEIYYLITFQIYKSMCIHFANSVVKGAQPETVTGISSLILENGNLAIRVHPGILSETIRILNSLPCARIF